MKRILFLVVIVLLLGLLFAAHTASQAPAGRHNGPAPPTRRRRLAQNTVIQGYPCAADYAWFYPDGKLNRGTVSRDTSFGEAQILTGSIIELRPDGTPQYVMLAHNATVLGYPAMGGSFPDPAEGTIMSFCPGGRLRSLCLAKDETIDGVPCRSGKRGILTDRRSASDGVEFCENGKLHACKLTRDYAGHREAQQIRLRPAPGSRPAAGARISFSPFRAGRIVFPLTVEPGLLS